MALERSRVPAWRMRIKRAAGPSTCQSPSGSSRKLASYRSGKVVGQMTDDEIKGRRPLSARRTALPLPMLERELPFAASSLEGARIRA